MKKNEKILLFLLFLFCLSLRLALITQKNLWFDELFSWKMVQGSFKDIITATTNDIHPPLFYFTLKIWIGILGDTVFSMRLLTALFNSCAIFFIYPVAFRVLNRTNSLLVLLLYCLSPLNLFFSQEVRMASLNVFLNAASVYYFIRLLEKGTENRLYKILSTYLYILATVLALYTHYFSFFILTAELAYLLFIFRLKIKLLIHFIWIYILIILCYLPWLPTMLKQVSRGQPWRYGQSVSLILNEALIYSRDITLGYYHRYIGEIFLMILTVLILIIIALFLFGYFYSPKEKNTSHSQSLEQNPNFFIFLLVFIPLLISMLVSYKQSIEFFRYLSILVPFIIILGFIGYQAFPSYVKVVVLIVTILINLYGDFLYYKYDYKNDDYREIIGTINTNYRMDDRVYVYPHYFSWSIDYYCKADKLSFEGSNNYGWVFESLLDALHTNPPNEFWFVLDYHSPDSSTYKDKVNEITSLYNISFEKTFQIIPDKVTLFRFVKK